MEKFRLMDLKLIKPEDMQTIEECAYVMRALDAEIADIDGKLTEAKMLAAAKRQYSDPRWFRNMTSLLKLARRARCAAQDRRSAMGRELKQAQSREWRERFVEAARLMLDEETFASILARARAAV